MWGQCPLTPPPWQGCCVSGPARKRQQGLRARACPALCRPSGKCEGARGHRPGSPWAWHAGAAPWPASSGGSRPHAPSGAPARPPLSWYAHRARYRSRRWRRLAASTDPCRCHIHRNARQRLTGREAPQVNCSRSLGPGWHVDTADLLQNCPGRCLRPGPGGAQGKASWDSLWAVGICPVTVLAAVVLSVPMAGVGCPADRDGRPQSNPALHWTPLLGQLGPPSSVFSGEEPQRGLLCALSVRTLPET